MDQHWKILFNALGIGIVVAGQDGSLEFANRQAAELLDCASQEETAARWDALKARISALFPAAAAQLPPGTGLDLEVPDGAAPRRLRLEVFPFNGNGRRALVLHDRDREPAAPDLLLMSRYHTLARLYRSLRHDLKAPLQAMTLNLELLKTSIARNPSADAAILERQQRYVKTLEVQLARLDGSLMSFLYQAVPPTQEAPARFCLCELLRETVALIAPQAGAQNVAIDLQPGGRSVAVEGHRDQLKQALLNIAVNALEAMSEGGRLTIKLETTMDHALILLRDTGCGMPTEVVDRIWELNYSTRKTGTGIGLYVARSVIESHGGAIGVQTRAGEGSCFTLTLPIAL